jgi:hypothetical protein
VVSGSHQASRFTHERERVKSRQPRGLLWSIVAFAVSMIKNQFR